MTTHTPLTPEETAALIAAARVIIQDIRRRKEPAALSQLPVLVSAERKLREASFPTAKAP